MKIPRGLTKLKAKLVDRWSESEHPGGASQFQLALLMKDILVFCVVPLVAIIFYKAIEASVSDSKSVPRRITPSQTSEEQSKSQIINFQNRKGGSDAGIAKRSPGTLVRVRLLNVIETFSDSPVHAQIVDNGLGSQFLGGTLLGNATPDNSSGRIKIDFRFARHPRRTDLAVPISARALSLDGSFGVLAGKKEGFFARAVIRSASANTIDAGSDNQDLKTMVARALASGLMQEFQSESATAHNKAQVLFLKPLTEFYVELTDYFPGQM